jgi:hypothetical protein
VNRILPALTISRRTILVASGVILLVAFLEPHPANAGFLTTMSQPFTLAFAGLRHQAQQWAAYLFFRLAPIEFIFVGLDIVFSREAAGGENLASALAAIAGFVAMAVFTWWGIANTPMILQSSNDFTNFVASSMASSVEPINNINGDSIAGIGFTLAHDLAVAVPPTLDPTVGFTEVIAAGIIDFSFIVLGFEYDFITLGTQFCIDCGAIVLGLYVLRFTRKYTDIFWQMLFVAFILRTAIGALVGVGIFMQNSYIGMLNKLAADPWNGTDNTIVAIACSVGAYALFATGFLGLAAFMGARAPLGVSGTMVGLASFAAARALASRAPSGNAEPIANIERAADTGDDEEAA